MNRIQTTRTRRPDYVIGLVVFGLLCVGLVMIYSISPVLSHKLLGDTSRNYYFFNTVVSLGFGFMAWAIVGKLDYHYWKKYAVALLVLALFCSLLLVVPGLSIAKNGATRWLKLGVISFQPAELLKLAMVVYLAVWFEKRTSDIRKLWDGLVPFGIMLLLICLLVAVLQKDLGTMMVLAASAVGMYFIAGSRLTHFGYLLVAGGLAVWVAIISFPHRIQRLSTFFNPSGDPSATGYHINQALIAIGTGGILGVGLGKSVQIYGYLPEAANDSIFAIIAEEFGLVGSLIVIVLFGILAWRGIGIAKRAPDSYGRLVAAGVTIWLTSQAAINIFAMLGLVPLTGVPLPFISYGGSSLVFALAGVGLLQNVSKYAVTEKTNANNIVGRGNRWPYLTNAGNGRSLKATR